MNLYIMYACMNVFVYVCMCVCIHVFMYVWLTVCMYEGINLWMYEGMYLCMYIFMYISSYVCMYECIYLCMNYVYVWICLCMNMFMYVCIQGVLNVPWPWFFSICKKTIKAINMLLSANFWYWSQVTWVPISNAPFPFSIYYNSQGCNILYHLKIRWFSKIIDKLNLF